MITWMLRRAISNMEREYDYDASALREVLETSPEAAIRFTLAGSMRNFEKGVSTEMAHAAAIRSVVRADCGPCVQLAVRFAQRAGVDDGLLVDLVSGELGSLPEDVRLAVRFADSVLDRDAGLEEARSTVEARFGRVGVVTLAFRVIASQLYPTLKYALGHGRACVAVDIAGRRVAPGSGRRSGRGALARAE